MKKEERHEIYKKALNQMKKAKQKDEALGLCGAIGRIVGFGNNYLFEYPEIFKHKPKIWYSIYYWFNIDDYDTRINILKQAIKETESFVKVKEKR